MVRAAGFLRRNYVGRVGRDQLAVWSNPVDSSPEVAKLGANGLGLVALAAARDAAPDSVPLQELQAIGNFALSLQRENGSFVQKYQRDAGPVRNWESLYYPGEAALGLIALYQADHSRKWLVAAAKALSYLAQSRAGLSRVPADHWALIATATIMPYTDQIASIISREELERHAVQICRSLLDDLEDPHIAARTAPVATRLEGMLAAGEFLPKGDLRDRIDLTVSQQVPRLLRAQIVTGDYTGGMPYRLEKDSRAVVRVDFVQHSLCVWLRQLAAHE